MHKMFENMTKGGDDPFGGQMANAQHMWSFLDELSESNPEEYEAFLKGQMQSAKEAKPKATMPEVGFCVRLRTQSGVALLVNVCSHVNIKPPSSTPDGSIPLCVGVPRACEHKGQPAHAVDLLVSSEVLDRATTNAAYREEMAALAADCAKGMLTEARLLPEALKPGYQVLPLHGAAATKYSGTLQPFVDARGPPPSDDGDGNEEADAMAGLGGGGGMPASLMQQLAGMGMGGGGSGGGSSGGSGGGGGGMPDMAEMIKHMGGMGGMGGGKGGKGGGGKGGGGGGKGGGGGGGGSGARREQSAPPAGRNDEELSALKLPGSGSMPSSGSGGGAASAAAGGAPSAPQPMGPARPLVQELSSAEAPLVTPTHELQAEGDVLRLCVQLPRPSELHKSCRAEPVLLSRGAAHTFPCGALCPLQPAVAGARGTGCFSQRPGSGGRPAQRGGPERPLWVRCGREAEIGLREAERPREAEPPLATNRQLSSAAELEVDVGTHRLKLAAEGVYCLDVPLPQAVDEARARCRFDKKKRTLTITMPLLATGG